MPEIIDAASALARLQAAHTIAVLGVSTRPGRPGYYVPEYLAERGYRVLPVNPRYVGQRLLGEPVRGTLAEIEEPIDLIDVFRNPADLPSHLSELLALRPPPGLVWFQLGIRNQAVADALVAADIDVVQDKCTLALLRSARSDLGA